MRESADTLLALARLSGVLAMVPDVERTLVLTHPGQPVAKERARWSPKNNRWYTPHTTAAAETALAWSFKAALGRRPPFTDTVGLVAMFFEQTRQRKDVDNLLKLVMDAATKARIWKDDSQVIVQASYLALEPRAPRTVVAIAPYVSSLSVAPLLTAAGAI